MILILTNSTDATADYLAMRLSDADIAFQRFDTDRALEDSEVSFAPGAVRFRLGSHWYSARDFSSVWYRRPEALESSKIEESPEGKCVLDEWGEAFEGVFAHIPRERWMNYPAANALASRKLEQLTTADRMGFKIPDTLVTQDPTALRSFFRKHDKRIIVKPLGRACIDGENGARDSVIFTNRVTGEHLDDLQDLARCPTLFQQEVPKRSDVRITIVDGDIHAFELTAADADGKQRCDIRKNNMLDVCYRSVSLPQQILSQLKQLTRHYELRFAAVDMAIAENGDWYFFEINPNGQWAWLDLTAGAEIYKSFISSFRQAVREHGS